MKLTPPTKNVYWIATVLAVLGLIGELTPFVAFLSGYSFWFALVAFVLLWLGVSMKGF